VSQELIFFIARINREDLELLAELVRGGRVTPTIDRRYSMSEVAEAIGYLGEGHARAKVVVSVD
jgi:NADPH:quinone reductase-like Zn-dependent oxidoreductase